MSPLAGLIVSVSGNRDARRSRWPLGKGPLDDVFVVFAFSTAASGACRHRRRFVEMVGFDCD